MHGSPGTTTRRERSAVCGVHRRPGYRSWTYAVAMGGDQWARDNLQPLLEMQQDQDCPGYGKNPTMEEISLQGGISPGGQIPAGPAFPENFVYYVRRFSGDLPPGPLISFCYLY
jgi:hypothetical protein